MEKVASNRRSEQAKNIQTQIFSIGSSANVAKILKTIFGDIFKTEAGEGYQSFSVSYLS